MATHEAGHATVAYLGGDARRLEVLSIVGKRAGSLGLLAHGDPDEVYTRTRSEMHALLEIALRRHVRRGVVLRRGWHRLRRRPRLRHWQVACEIVGSAGMAGSLVSPLAAVENGALNNSNLCRDVCLPIPTRPPEVDRILNQVK